MSGPGFYLVENKGQVKDQYGNPRNDIQYVLHDKGINIFIGNGQMHYQFYKTETPEQQLHFSQCKNEPCYENNNEHNIITTYRMDVELSGAFLNNPPISEGVQDYYEHYFVPGCPLEGITAHCYQKITYKNVYPFIDWVLYIKGDHLEQEFIVGKGGDPALINLIFHGQTDLRINDDGSIIAATPMGVIKEYAPLCILASKKKEPISYLLNGNTLSYNLAGQNLPLIIDPTVEWGTYYGPDSNSSPLKSITRDDNANLYACGSTYAASTGNVATSGGFQTTYGGNCDAYLIKFDSSGHRLWGTYYGGTWPDYGQSVTCDHFGNVYLGGYTASTDTLVIATPGSHQPSNGGGWDGFLAKFTSSGARIWATYYGGNQKDEVNSVVCDGLMHVYIAGEALSTNNIATPGSFEDSFANSAGQYVAGFLTQFDTNGVRNWGTYYKAYEDTSLTDLLSVYSCSDGNFVYITGISYGSDSVSTPGSWQPVYGGGASDAFVAKFGTAGNRYWATFYGGPDQDVSGSIACDGLGNVFLLGSTYSDSGISSAGAWQPHRSGGADAFLAKFETAAGMRQWSTYYGGPGDEIVDYSQICTDLGGSAYIVGLTESSSGIASTGAWQTTYGGGDHDGFFAKYGPSGSQLWSTYYGGLGDDQAFSCVYDGLNVYLCGMSNSSNNIATAGSFDAFYDGDTLYNKGFIAKFADNDSSSLFTPTGNFAFKPVCEFPNPVINSLNLYPLEPGDEIRLFDFTGRALLENVILTEGLFTFYLGQYPSGVYTISVSDKHGNIKTRKLIEKL